jgi:hypothetical protein
MITSRPLTFLLVSVILLQIGGWPNQNPLLQKKNQSMFYLSLILSLTFLQTNSKNYQNPFTYTIWSIPWFSFHFLSLSSCCSSRKPTISSSNWIFLIEKILSPYRFHQSVQSLQSIQNHHPSLKTATTYSLSLNSLQTCFTPFPFF